MTIDPNNHTFLLRIWKSADGSCRILLQDPSGGQPEGFSTLDDLSIHLKALTEETTTSPPCHRYTLDDNQPHTTSAHNSTDSDLPSA